jgi:hypothetical protein
MLVGRTGAWLAAIAVVAFGCGRTGLRALHPGDAPSTPNPPDTKKDARALVLWIDPAQGDTEPRWLFFDRTGSLVSEAPDGSGLGGRRRTVTIATMSGFAEIGAPAPPSAVRLEAQLVPGAVWQRPATQILASSFDPDSRVTHVRGFDGRGSKTFEHELEGGWSNARLSPRGGFFYLDEIQRPGSPSAHAMVVQAESGKVYWKGELSSGVFSEDDAYFAFTAPTGAGPRVSFVSLASSASCREACGTVTEWPAPEEVGELTPLPRIALRARAANRHGALFETTGDITFGSFLWIVGQDGRWRHPGGQVAHFEERLLGFSAGGEVAILARSGMTGGAAISIFRFDLASGDSGPIESVSGLYADETVYRMLDDSLVASPIGGGGTRIIKHFSRIEPPWERTVGAVSDDGGAIAISALWNADALPRSIAADLVHLVDRNGEDIVALDPGDVLLDRTGEIALVRRWVDVSLAHDRVIFADLEGRKTTERRGDPALLFVHL